MKASGSIWVTLRGQTTAIERQLRYNPRYSPVAQSVERLTVNQEVAGSSPARGANHLSVLATEPSSYLRFLSGAEVASGGVEAIHGCLVCTGDQVTVGVDGHLNGMMPHLLFDVRRGFPVLEKARCEGVAQGVWTNAAEPSPF